MSEFLSSTIATVYYVYILQCVDGTLYTGIAVDIPRRVIEHNTSQKGAKYTRMRRPVTLVYTSEPFDNRSQASAREYQIKQMSRQDKLTLIQNNK